MSLDLALRCVNNIDRLMRKEQELGASVSTQGRWLSMRAASGTLMPCSSRSSIQPGMRTTPSS